MSSVSHTEPTKVQPTAEKDPRLVRLRQFFIEHHCPIRDLAKDFIVAADNNALDWRLLPSLAMVESGGGKAFQNNNIFGWGNAKLKFASIRHGIHIVGHALGRSILYRDKNLPQMLWVYNPKPVFRVRVESMMASLGPELVSADQ